MTTSTEKPSRKREWAPRIWEGSEFFGWLRLLARNRFAVAWSYSYIAVIVTVVSIVHTLLRLVEEAVYGPRVRRTVIPEAPLFIVGHWRTGTTLLHELLIQDARHTFPTTYECLDPNHFLLTVNWLPPLLVWMLPSRRPMDNMPAGWERPQEDEFAMCLMGQPSPYLTIAFPNHPPQDQAALDLDGLTSRARRSWCRAFLYFLKKLTFHRHGRLVLKSPTHTCRIKHLLRLFPEARFVHIVRDPYVVFPSTVNLWKTLYETHGLQHPTFAGLEEHVFATFSHLHARLEEDKGLIEPRRFYELRYEGLVGDPLGEMRKLYDHLELGGFEEVLPRLESYVAGMRSYQTNRYGLQPAVRAEITRRWGDVIRRYGYAAEATPKKPLAV